MSTRLSQFVISTSLLESALLLFICFVTVKLKIAKKIQMLAKNITDDVKTTIRQNLLSEINQTVSKAIKQALSEERRKYTQTPSSADSWAAEPQK